MELKKCTTCHETPKMSKEDGNWTISCKCGPERKLVAIGSSKESAIRQYNVNMCLSDKDIVITVRIPEDADIPVSINCNAPYDGWEKRYNEMRDYILELMRDYAK
jgi:hypothetical protein